MAHAHTHFPVSSYNYITLKFENLFLFYNRRKTFYLIVISESATIFARSHVARATAATPAHPFSQSHERKKHDYVK